MSQSEWLWNGKSTYDPCRLPLALHAPPPRCLHHPTGSLSVWTQPWKLPGALYAFDSLPFRHHCHLLKKKQHIYFFNRTWPVLYKITNTWLIKTPDWHMWLLLFPIGNTMQIKHRFIYSRLCGQTLLLLSCPADSHWPQGEISCTLCILVFLKTWMKDKTLDCTSVLNVSRIPNKEIQDPVFEVQEHSFQMAEYWL